MAYDALADVTSCGVCKIGEHGRCRGGGCTCQVPRCTALRAVSRPTATATTKEAAPVPESPLRKPIALPEPDHAVGQHGCSVCGRTFATAHGLQVHRARKHGIAGARSTPTKAKPTRRLEPVPSPVAAAAPPPTSDVHISTTATLLERLVSSPGEWAEVGRIELQARDGGAVFARFLPADAEGAA